MNSIVIGRPFLKLFSVTSSSQITLSKNLTSLCKFKVIQFCIGIFKLNNTMACMYAKCNDTNLMSSVNNAKFCLIGLGPLIKSWYMNFLHKFESPYTCRVLYNSLCAII